MVVATEGKINTLAYNPDLPTPAGTLSPRSIRNKGSQICVIFDRHFSRNCDDKCMIKTLKEFFNRLKVVMKDDFYIEELDAGSKEYIDQPKNPKFKLKTGLMIDQIPFSYEIEKCLENED